MPFFPNFFRSFQRLASDTAPQPPPKFLKWAWHEYSGLAYRVFSTTVKTALLAHVCTEYLYTALPSKGPSMLPTLEVLGDWTLISRKYRRGRGIQVGDVVSFDSVGEPGEGMIKRILGLEGDYVMRYTPESGSNKMIQVPRGHCWVVGDNLDFSRDSRHFGPVPMALIKGKVIGVVLPWTERRWVVNSLQPFSHE